MQRSSHTNVEFHLGDIEQMPVPDATADVVVSNCVLNLVPDKRAVFSEIFRVLKPGGISAFGYRPRRRAPGEVSQRRRNVRRLRCRCVRSNVMSIQRDNVERFENLAIQKEKAITIPRHPRAISRSS
ncbi:MAG: methyltransferase domain-containing protein [Pyrinomonadaceae bacterium]